MTEFETISDIKKKKAPSSTKRNGVVTAYRLNNVTPVFIQSRTFKTISERKMVMSHLLGIWGGSIAFFQIEFK